MKLLIIWMLLICGLGGLQIIEAKPQKHGVCFVPVIVTITVNSDKISNGMEVRIQDPNVNMKKGGGGDAFWKNLVRNYGKPVKTDINSVAVVWLLTNWFVNDEGELVRNIEADLIIGDLKKPLYHRKLIEIIKREDANTKPSSPILLSINVKVGG